MVVSNPVLLGHVIRCIRSDRIYSPIKVIEERFCVGLILRIDEAIKLDRKMKQVKIYTNL